MPQPSLHQPKPQCIVGQLNNRRVGQLVKTTKRKLIMMGNHGSRHEELLSNQQIVPSTLLNTEPHEENSQTTCLSFPTVSLRRCLSQCRYSGAMASQDNPRDLQVMHRMVVSPSYAPCVTKRRVGHSTQRRVFSEITSGGIRDFPVYLDTEGYKDTLKLYSCEPRGRDNMTLALDASCVFPQFKSCRRLL